MLIDLTSPQQQEMTHPSIVPNNVFDCSFLAKLNDMSILDAPIDVPTQTYFNEEFSTNSVFDSSKPMPPPYQSPPTYMNTYGLNKTSSMYAANPLGSNQYGNLDPFDTSHVAAGHSLPHSSDEHSRADGNYGRTHILRPNNANGMDLGQVSCHRPSATNEIDEIVQQSLASDGAKNTEISVTDMLKKLQYSDESSLKTSNNTTLNVNLSSTTLNDTDNFETLSLPTLSAAQNPKLSIDHAFLSELEKEIKYSDVNVNKGQTNELPNNTFNAIPNSNWLKNDFASSADTSVQMHYHKNEAQIPSKYQPAKANNSEIPHANVHLTKKFYNTEVVGADTKSIYHNLTKSEISTKSTVPATADGSSQSIYSNYSTVNSIMNSGVPTRYEQNVVDFVPTICHANGAGLSNMYSVASDIYGSAAGGNVYDVVAPNDAQSVIYDEVAADDLRPHRPAPVPPVLSAQQIQRRLERAQKEQQVYGNLGSNYSTNDYTMAAGGHFVYEEIIPKIYETTELSGKDHESKESFNSINSEAIKNAKIEQLLR